MENEKCIWQGKSKKEYTFFIHEYPHDFKRNQDGNYIFAKISNKSWKPVYIGQGDLGDRISENHHQHDCVKSKEATHVHVHLNKHEQDRLSEEKDLLANYSMAYTPEGCNVKQGG